MSPSANSLVQHILHEVDYLLRERKSLTKDSFLLDETRRRAFARSIEIIGEAAKQLPTDFRQQSTQIPWKEIAGMRDRLIHAYFSVDYEIVWDVVENRLEPLEEELLKILRDDSQP